MDHLSHCNVWIYNSFAIFLQELSIWSIVSLASLHNLHFASFDDFSIPAFIAFVQIDCSWAANIKDSVSMVSDVNHSQVFSLSILSLIFSIYWPYSVLLCHLSVLVFIAFFLYSCLVCLAFSNFLFFTSTSAFFLYLLLDLVKLYGPFSTQLNTKFHLIVVFLCLLTSISENQDGILFSQQCLESASEKCLWR